MLKRRTAQSAQGWSFGSRATREIFIGHPWRENCISNATCSAATNRLHLSEPPVVRLMQINDDKLHDPSLLKPGFGTVQFQEIAPRCCDRFYAKRLLRSF